MCYYIIVCSYSQSHRRRQNYKTENKKSYFLRLKYHYVVRIWVIRTLTRRPYKELPYRPYRPEVRKESKNLAVTGESLIFVAVSGFPKVGIAVWESKGKRVRIPYSSRCCMLLRLRADVWKRSLDTDPAGSGRCPPPERVRRPCRCRDTRFLPARDGFCVGFYNLYILSMGTRRACAPKPSEGFAPWVVVSALRAWSL